MTVRPCSTILELKADTKALERLAELEGVAAAPPMRGGFYFSDEELDFIRSARRSFDTSLGFTPEQRERIVEIWQTIYSGRQPCAKSRAKCSIPSKY